MRQVCDSTYLIDRETNISPKLKELEGLLDELVIQNNRKVVIFSEWTSMTFLIAKHMSRVGIDFVELSGRVPVKKRQNLIDEFSCNPQCKVFLSTDAGSTGLNLQAADCVINFELPWNPAKKNQRIGRVNRIGQKSGCVNVVNLIAKNSIEEKIMAGLKLKTELFQGVFDGGTDMVEFSQARRTELLNQLREMMGEDLLVERAEERDPDEIPEDTPHYLNPQALAEAEATVAYTGEEFDSEDGGAQTSEAAASGGNGGDADRTATQTSADGGQTTGEGRTAEQSSAKMEEVLNSGMKFLGGLLEMATGQKIESTSGDDKMIVLDKDTGEVTLKFKLPGF